MSRSWVAVRLVLVFVAAAAAAEGPTPAPAPLREPGIKLGKGGTRVGPASPLVTRRPPPPPPPPSEPSEDEASSDAVTYGLPSNEASGNCILLRVDALLEFKYRTSNNELIEKDKYVPETPDISGDCSGEDNQKLYLKWQSFILKFFFSKTPGGERWFLEKVELSFNSDDKLFEHRKPTGWLSLSSKERVLFMTPVGNSFACPEVSVQLTSDNDKGKDVVANLLLRKVKLEPFIFKGDFGPEYGCSIGGGGSRRSETAPLVVGSLLAATCLLTITGYAAYRYFKIKKVQYDTME